MKMPIKPNFRLSLLLYVLFGTVFFGCTENENENPIELALASESPLIKKVTDRIEKYELQIRYTQIDRNGDSLLFKDYDFQVDKNQYFYPASTVKFPAAVAALEKLNEIDSLDRDYRFYVEGDSLETTFSEAVLQIFAVSDNQANNRLVEFLGFDDLNRRMRQKGVAPIRISHRLSTSDADEVTTKPLIFYLNDSTTSVSEPLISKSPVELNLKSIKKGTGFYAQDSLYQEPFDFSLKNYYPIDAQHALLKRIIFPEVFPEEERFNLSEAQRSFLLDAMRILPQKLGYDKEEYYDSYGKFFMFGDLKKPMPNTIEIYNKVGYAYGTLTDCAYIKDTQNNVDFMLTATILVNEDGVFNDDNYEYDKVGIPFLAQLGREIHEIELKRKRWAN